VKCLSIQRQCPSLRNLSNQLRNKQSLSREGKHAHTLSVSTNHVNDRLTLKYIYIIIITHAWTSVYFIRIIIFYSYYYIFDSYQYILFVVIYSFVLIDSLASLMQAGKRSLCVLLCHVIMLTLLSSSWACIHIPCIYKQFISCPTIQWCANSACFMSYLFRYCQLIFKFFI